jgi:hypothetical protein
MTITLSSSDTAWVSFVMIWCTTVATESLLEELGACTDWSVSEMSFVADTAALSALFVIAGVVCPNVMQLHRPIVVMRT